MTDRNAKSVQIAFLGRPWLFRAIADLSKIASLLLALLLFLLMLAHGCKAQAPRDDTRQILLIYEYDSTLQSVRQVSEGLYQVFEQADGPKVEIYSEYLDLLRFPDAGHAKQLSDYLAVKYRGKKFDIVLAGGPNALRFVLENRTKIGSGAPVIFGGVNRSNPGIQGLPRDVKGIVSAFDIIGTVNLARRLQADATKIVVITGSSKFDRNWQSNAKKALGDRFDGVDVEYVSGLSLKGYELYVNKLDNDAIVILLAVAEDANGRKYAPYESARHIAAASNAPVYTVYSSYLWPGIIGGKIGTFEEIGREMGLLAVQTMNGDMSAPQVSEVRDGYILDWREIVRRGLDPALAPAGATFLNYEPSAWERYKIVILSAAAVIFLQFATIATLIFQERRRRKMAVELETERLELVHLARATKLGELSGAFAHELSQPLTSILANAEVVRLLLEANSFDVQEMRDIINDIIMDNRRAVIIIRQLRELLVKGETNNEIFNLNDAIIATVEMTRSELTFRKTVVDLQLHAALLPVRGNYSQIQQIVLNLLINAAEAMSEVDDEQRTVAILTRECDNKLRELVVSDRGPGIPLDLRTEIFKPFLSTKENGLGLGLAICQTIAQAHGGRLRIQDDPSPGATIVLELPAP